MKSASPNSGPFTIKDDLGNTLGTNVTLSSLIHGIAYEVDSKVEVITLISSGDCEYTKRFSVLRSVPLVEYQNIQFQPLRTGCLWTHLRNDTLYNYYYGDIKPYIIEYPFAYKYHDQILQNIKDYSKVYTYIPSLLGEFDANSKIQTDDKYFNKACPIQRSAIKQVYWSLYLNL